jgi:hypothetical protein
MELASKLPQKCEPLKIQGGRTDEGRFYNDCSTAIAGKEKLLVVFPDDDHPVRVLGAIQQRPLLSGYSCPAFQLARVH